MNSGVHLLAWVALPAPLVGDVDSSTPLLPRGPRRPWEAWALLRAQLPPLSPRCLAYALLTLPFRKYGVWRLTGVIGSHQVWVSRQGSRDRRLVLGQA